MEEKVQDCCLGYSRNEPLKSLWCILPMVYLVLWGGFNLYFVILDKPKKQNPQILRFQWWYIWITLQFLMWDFSTSRAHCKDFLGSFLVWPKQSLSSTYAPLLPWLFHWGSFLLITNTKRCKKRREQKKNAEFSLKESLMANIMGLSFPHQGSDLLLISMHKF